MGRDGWCRMKQVFSGVLKEMAHKLWRVYVRRSILPLLSTETCLWSTLPICCCTTACMKRPMSCCSRPCRSTAQRYALTLTCKGNCWTPHPGLYHYFYPVYIVSDYITRLQCLQCRQLTDYNGEYNLILTFHPHEHPWTYFSDAVEEFKCQTYNGVN